MKLKNLDPGDSIPLEVTFLLNLFCSSLRKPFSPTLSELCILGKTRMIIGLKLVFNTQLAKDLETAHIKQMIFFVFFF